MKNPNFICQKTFFYVAEEAQCLYYLKFLINYSRNIKYGTIINIFLCLLFNFLLPITSVAQKPPKYTFDAIRNNDTLKLSFHITEKKQEGAIITIKDANIIHQIKLLHINTKYFLNIIPKDTILIIEALKSSDKIDSGTVYFGMEDETGNNLFFNKEEGYEYIYLSPIEKAIVNISKNIKYKDYSKKVKKLIFKFYQINNIKTATIYIRPLEEQGKSIDVTLKIDELVFLIRSSIGASSHPYTKLFQLNKKYNKTFRLEVLESNNNKEYVKLHISIKVNQSNGRIDTYDNYITLKNKKAKNIEIKLINK